MLIKNGFTTLYINIGWEVKLKESSNPNNHKSATNKNNIYNFHLQIWEH